MAKAPSNGDDQQAVFVALRKLLHVHAPSLTVNANEPKRYSLEARTGPATLAAWGGKKKSNTIPIAWTEIGKSYVSFHLMGLPGNSKLVASLSPALKARMQGISCFNFRHVDDALFDELREVTAKSIAGLKRTGFIAD